MSDLKGVESSNTGVISKSRRHSILLAIGQFVRLLSWNQKEDPASSQSRQLYGSAGVENTDYVAREVYPRVCAIPDDCKWPQEALFNFTKEVIDRKQHSASRTIVDPLPSADRQALLISEVRALEPEARKVMLLSVEGKHFREIARLLDLPERHVLDVLRVSYSTVRMRTLPCDDEPLPAVHSQESTSK